MTSMSTAAISIRTAEVPYVPKSPKSPDEIAAEV